MRGWAALLLAVAGVAALNASGSAAPTASVTTFTLTSSVVGSNPNAPELTIDAAGQKASDHHCCDGGKWDIEYFWKVPTSFTAGKSTTATLGISSMTAVPVQPILIQTTIRAPDFAQPFQMQYPNQTSGSKDFTIPISASYTGSKTPITFIVGVVSAEVVYTYTPNTTTTTPPTPKCRRPSSADASGTHKVTWSFNVSGVPARGESPTLVGSTTAGRGTFTVCGDPSKGKYLTGTGATGTIVHLDRHAHLGRVVTDKLVLKVVGARVRVANGDEVGDVIAELYVKVISSNDPQCKPGSLGSIIADRTIPQASSSLAVRLCGADHSHDFRNRDAKVEAFVSVAVH